LVGLGIGLAVKVGTEVTVGLTAGFLVAVAVRATGELVGGMAVEFAGAVGVAPRVGTDVCVDGIPCVGGTVVAVG
jgi:hypothetical protein